MIKKTLRQNKLGFLLFFIVCINSLFYTIYINSEKKYDSTHLLDFSKYVIFSNNKKVRVSNINSNTIQAQWSNANKDDKLYIQLFDRGFSIPPSEKYQSLAKINKANEVQIDLFGYMGIRENMEGTLFFIQYDDNKLVKSESSPIKFRRLQTINSLNFKISKESKYYKIAIRIYPTKSEGEVFIKNMEVLWK